LQIDELAKRMRGQNITVQANAAVVKFIADKSFDPNQGARLVRRNVQEYMENPLAERVIAGASKEGSTVKVSVKDGKLVFKQ
jgi:ATP-dependent Clp protease ATP-binding subunit ClpA